MPFVMQQHNHHKKFSKNKGKNRKTFQNPIHCCQTKHCCTVCHEKKELSHVMSVNSDTWNCYLTSLRSKRFSARVRQEHWDESNKKKEWQGRGRGGGEKETLARKPHDFEKLCSPTNSAFDWLGAGSVDYLASETSIKAGMFCWPASQIWSDVICGRRLQMLWSDIYLNHVCAKVYQIWVSSIKSIIGDRAVETSEGQFIGNDGVRIWLEKMDCLLEIAST